MTKQDLEKILERILEQLKEIDTYMEACTDYELYFNALQDLNYFIAKRDKLRSRLIGKQYDS